jgi:hypothetical protein
MTAHAYGDPQRAQDKEAFGLQEIRRSTIRPSGAFMLVRCISTVNKRATQYPTVVRHQMRRRNTVHNIAVGRCTALLAFRRCQQPFKLKHVLMSGVVLLPLA